MIHTRSQYSYLWDNIPEVITAAELDEWHEINTLATLRLAEWMVNKNSFDYRIGKCSGASHYHATWIDDPYWASSMTKCGKVGRHIYYKGK